MKPECITRLNRYHDSDHCYQHEGKSPSPAGDDIAAVMAEAPAPA